MSFTKLIAGVRGASEGVRTLPIDATWAQGRTTFGGIGAAVALSAAMDTLTADKRAPPLRSVLVNFVGPILGGQTMDVQSTVLRAGKSVTTTEATIKQNDACCLKLIASFGVDRPTSVTIPPATASELGVNMPPLDSVKATRTPPAPAGPGFLNNFEIRWVDGKLFPRSKPASRRTSMWLRHRDPEAFKACPAAAIVAIADMPPPVIMLHYDKQTMASSLSWSLEFAVPPESITDEWFFLDYHLDSAANGYSQQTGRVFSSDGKLVAYSRQCMAFFEPKL